MGLRLGQQSDAEDADERALRKAHESELLDEANDESFPASDPASPYVAPKRVRRDSPP